MFFFGKIGNLFKPFAAPRIGALEQLALIPKPIRLCAASYQGLYAKSVSMMFPKCSTVENDGELMMMAQSNDAIFPRVFQVYTQTYSRNKHCQNKKR